MPLKLTLPTEITFRGKTFYVKEEFHCSLVCAKCIMAELIENHGREAGLLQDQILNEVEAIRKYYEPVFLGYREELRLVTKEDNQTIVIMADIGKLEPIFEHLRREYPIDIPPQPTHVTLYSTKHTGIGISTPQELDKTMLIKGAELEELKLAMNFDKVFSKDLI